MLALTKRQEAESEVAEMKMLSFLLGVTRSIHPSVCLALNDFYVHVKYQKSAFYLLSSLWNDCLTFHPFSEKFRRGTLS